MGAKYQCGHCGGLFDQSYIRYVFFVDADKPEEKTHKGAIFCKDCEDLRRAVRKHLAKMSDEQNKSGLTPQELQIILKWFRVPPNELIAEYGDGMLKHHLSNIFKKLGVSTRPDTPAGFDVF